MSVAVFFPPASRRYILTSIITAVLYVLSIKVISWGQSQLDGPLLWGAILVPVGCIAVQLWATLRLMTQVDEFMRALLARRFIIAACLAFIVASAWGFLETFARVDHLPGYMVYAIFWVAFCIVSPFIRSTR
ncbi:hypothetical protein [Nitrospirillum bahiense]|uniref:Uncharacterized protein n=1 Tax=Nitrospirillum amazonense TaxID=28077 RepID=A0A560FBB8_9PROT|nr:hypothetical protein [Nitrospirillum amazonense]TWB18908.1 hypothetical protein FBZ88_12365 [Nitrospirillum amazonense]